MDADEVKRLRVEMSEASRVRSLLERHVEILAAEENQERAPEDIGAEVLSAITQAEQLIGIDVRDRFKRSRQTALLRKRAATMSLENATAAFLQAVANAEASQANGQVTIQTKNSLRALV